ncbi:MAG: ATP-binding cassette domain-containing protein [Acetatifactor sp.]|nr:ATP-binding cassette domain-containing protein [Acetatifactor sp.]
MIQLEEVSKFVLSDVSLYVPEGEIVGLVGASGAGKTTLLRLICGLLQADGGRVRTLGRDPVVWRRYYGAEISTFLTGVPLLCREDTVQQGFELMKILYHISDSQFKRDYQKLSESLDFGKYVRETVKNLSLGQRMRVELGAALICRPRLLLLDEPSIGLDENGKAALWELLEERSGMGMTVLVTSHDMTGISRLCSRIALLDGGKLVFYGSEKNLRSRYAPVDVMTVNVSGQLPDLEDLPLKHYSVEGSVLTMSYDSNRITSAEILSLILSQTGVSGVNIRKPNLESIITQLKEGRSI